MEKKSSTSLVADYDSSTDEDDSNNKTNFIALSTVPLVPASEMFQDTSKGAIHSVFTNPYKESENYEQSVLEKHVKMSTDKETSSDQVRPCYKFYKGKCKLGEKCNFSHCNPIYNNTQNINNEEETVKAIKSKKRCGLNDGLIPPKKYMKIFNKNKV